MFAGAMYALYRRLGPRYPGFILIAQFQVASLIVVLGVGLLTVYVTMSTGQFVRLVLVGEALLALENLGSVRRGLRLLAPARTWLEGRRDAATTAAAWHALVGLPMRLVRSRWLVAVLWNALPWSIFATYELGLAAASVLILLAGALVVVTYGILLRLLGLELSMQPIVAEVARELPDGARIETGGLPLRWKLLGGLPAINVITGVVVAGLSSHGTATLRDLGVDVLVAVAVAFTVSLELTLLLSRSILLPLEQLRDATVRIGQGDFGVRVPVLANDETGVLSEAFNQAAAGLEERERLRDAFGVYLDPTVAEHVMREDGAAQHGQEREVTVLFVDIRGFTAFAERASPREVVRRLNEFYELVVPILQRHGGHVDSFIGDGLLGVFGAPDRLPDHADRAVAAALEMVRSVRERYRDMLRIGIGVNTGRVVAGTIGGGGRLEFTVIGDVVNTASRVEALTRDTGDDILITAATRARLTREPVPLEERPLAELPGRAEPVGLFAARELEVTPPAGDLITELSETVVELAD